MKMKPMRVRIESSDMDSILPDSPLYKKVMAQLAESVLDPDQKKYLEFAKKNLHQDGDLEFDDDSAVSMGADDGAYVMCWQWVSDEDAGIQKD